MDCYFLKLGKRPQITARKLNALLTFPLCNYLRESVMVSQTSRNSKAFSLTINTQVHTSHCQCRSRAAGDRCSHRAHRCGLAAACLSMQCAHGQSMQMHSSAKRRLFYFSHFLFYLLLGPVLAIMKRLFPHSHPCTNPSHNSFSLPAFQIRFPEA